MKDSRALNHGTSRDGKKKSSYPTRAYVPLGQGHIHIDVAGITVDPEELEPG